MFHPVSGRRILSTVWLVTLHFVASFHLFPRIPTSRLPTIQTKDQLFPCIPSPGIRTRSIRLSSTELNAENESDQPDASSNPSDENYDGLYEFLTRRTGEQAGEPERRRKRDRIRDWMSSSGNSNMIQPIRMEDGGIIQDDDDVRPKSRARLERLLSGMPSLDSILSKEGQDLESSAMAEDDPGLQLSDDSWFDAEKKEIELEYQKILEDMKYKIEQQRLQDPESVPDNAVGVAESVVEQECRRTLATIKLERSRERLSEYETDQKTNLEKKDLDGVTDDVVEKILKESAEEWQRQEALQAEVDEFMRYEAEALNSMEDMELPQPGENMDSWALERLQEMLKTTQEGDHEDSTAVSDILEQQIEELQDQIERESRKGTIEPQTMKEWQIYRAIASRLRKDRSGKAVADPKEGIDGIGEEEVAKQLNSWREYIGKEEEIRKRAGLAVGPKMPFDWQRAQRNPDEDKIAVATQDESSPSKSRREMRRDVNMQAIQALEALVQKSDSVRAENLKQQLETLKAELEPRDYNDVEEEVVEEASIAPVDLSDVFANRERLDEPSLPSRLYEEERVGFDRVLSSNSIDEASFQDNSYKASSESLPNPPFLGGVPPRKETPRPPDTPFFAGAQEEDMFEDKAPPPDTPFFSSSDDTQEKEAIDVENTKLGSADDQKLMNMYRKAGARTREEQDNIREQWEAFQALEKTKRDESGLSDESDSSVVQDVPLKYDFADVMKGDGDFDAEKVLAAIGPRPSRRKTSREPSTSSNDAEKVPTSSLDPAEVSESLYRTVSAVGGGRTRDDPVAREEQKADFEAYMNKETEMRESLDQLDEDAARLVSETNAQLDDQKYAQDALASLGPRPVVKKRKVDVIDEKEFSDRGGILSSEADDLDDDDDSDDDEMDEIETSSVGLIPDWLQKERETMKKSADYESRTGLSGRDIDEVFDDDEYDHNLRQLHEYEQRRSGRQKQMGIDISDVLGRRGRSSDDYADYSYDDDYFRSRKDGWGGVNFASRKANLLEYVELSTIEINNLMDHRDSSVSTGVSQYLPRINKPFKEFGAIFRLEGVLFDLTGIQSNVWLEISEEYGFRPPSFEDVRRASVVRPDVAVRDVFFWTNDMFALKEITASFEKKFQESFDSWATEKGLKTIHQESNFNTQGSMALGADELQESAPAPMQQTAEAPRQDREEVKLKRLQEAWLRTARELEVREPSNEEIVQSSFLAPEIAVRDVFRWTRNQEEIDAVVSVFNAILTGSPGPSQTDGDVPSVESSVPLSEGMLLEYQYKAWIRIAQEGAFAEPSPEEIFAASVLNDPEAVVLNGFGWTNDVSLAGQLASKYREYLSEMVGDTPGPRPVTPASSEPSLEVTRESISGPADSDILETQVQAWKVTASTHGFGPPPVDQIQLTMNMAASDSVRRLLGWTFNFNEEQISAITRTYSDALRDAAEAYMKRNNIQPMKVEEPTRIARESSPYPSQDQLYQAAFDAWTNVAWKSGFSLPDQEQVLFGMSVGPEEAIVTGFRWTDNLQNATLIADEYREQIRLKRLEWENEGYSMSSGGDDASNASDDIPAIVVLPGVSEWIKSLRDVDMACGVVSYLEKSQVDILLDYAGLSGFFPSDKRVSMTNGYSRDSQQLLGMALRIERRPDHCVVFDSSPMASVAAHEVEMRSVSLVGPYPRYELLSADSSASSFDELTAMNIRRLFGERVYDQPMLDIVQNQPEVNRKTKTAFWDED